MHSNITRMCILNQVTFFLVGALVRCVHPRPIPLLHILRTSLIQVLTAQPLSDYSFHGYGIPSVQRNYMTVFSSCSKNLHVWRDIHSRLSPRWIIVLTTLTALDHDNHDLLVIRKSTENRVTSARFRINDLFQIDWNKSKLHAIYCTAHTVQHLQKW